MQKQLKSSPQKNVYGKASMKYSFSYRYGNLPASVTKPRPVGKASSASKTFPQTSRSSIHSKTAHPVLIQLLFTVNFTIHPTEIFYRDEEAYTCDATSYSDPQTDVPFMSTSTNSVHQIYEYTVKIDNCRPLILKCKQNCLSLGLLKKALRKQANLSFSKCCFASKFLLNKHMVTDNSTLIFSSDDIEYLAPSLGGGPVSENIANKCCAKCCQPILHNKKYVIAKNKYDLTANSVLCIKCNMKLEREYIESLSAVKLKQKRQKDDCFIQGCCEVSEYQKSYEDLCENICLCFSMKPAASSTDVINLCTKHNFIYYNFLKLHSK